MEIRGSGFHSNLQMLNISSATSVSIIIWQHALSPEIPSMERARNKYLPFFLILP
jgi:hypothetical protein